MTDDAKKAARKGKVRYGLVDAVRGCAIVSMVAYHFLYDRFVFFGGDMQWAFRPEIVFWERTICVTFILVSGFSWSFGVQKNVGRGVLLNLLGCGISLVTWIAAPKAAIWFGILNFLGCAALLLYPARRLLQKVPPLFGIACSLAGYLLLYHVPQGYVGFDGGLSLRLPETLYSCRVLTPLGFPYDGFFSSDYFPVLPWIFLYLCGYFLYRMFERSGRMKKAALRSFGVLSAAGRRSLFIYLLHQPLCLLLCLALANAG